MREFAHVASHGGKATALVEVGRQRMAKTPPAQRGAAARGCQSIDERLALDTSVDTLILQCRNQGIVDFRYG
jgi:hypothetical protein